MMAGPGLSGRLACISALWLSAAPVLADAVAPIRVVRSQSLIMAEDIGLVAGEWAGAFTDPVEVIGLEARAVLYPGRVIRPGDVGPPAIVERNQIITVVFRRGPLSIEAEGRALGRAGTGEEVRAMNVASRNTIIGVAIAPGRVEVSQ